MIQFQFPELFLLAIPLALAYRRWGSAKGFTGILRVTLLVLLLLALTGPRWNLGGEGIDVVIVADRSRSLPEKTDQSIRELIHDLERNRKSGDRIGLVTFGSRGGRTHAVSQQRAWGVYACGSAGRVRSERCDLVGTEFGRADSAGADFGDVRW